MGSQIGSKDNVKIYVLNLMMSIGYPVDFTTLNDALRQTDFVDYFDFADAFHKMEDDGLLTATGMNEQGEPCYSVTSKGACVVESMRGHILPSVLEDSVVHAMRYLDFRRRGVKVSCKLQPQPDGGYYVICTVTERDRTDLSITLWVEDEATARRMETQFRERPENAYRGVRALLSGNVNYLFDR